MNLETGLGFLWVVLNGFLEVLLLNRILRHKENRRQKKIRRTVWGSLILLFGIGFVLLSKRIFEYGWLYMLVVSAAGFVILYGQYKETRIMVFSSILALSVIYQLGALLMESCSLFFFQQETASLPFWLRFVARATCTGMCFLVGLFMTRFRIRKLDRGMTGAMGAGALGIISFFYLLFLCLCALLLPQPWEALFQRQLILMLPLILLYLGVSEAATLQIRKKDLRERQELENTIAAQRMQMSLLQDHTFNLSAIRHDYRNVFLTAEQLIAEKRMEEAMELMEVYQKSLEKSLERDNKNMNGMND